MTTAASKPEQKSRSSAQKSAFRARVERLISEQKGELRAFACCTQLHRLQTAKTRSSSCCKLSRARWRMIAIHYVWTLHSFLRSLVRFAIEFDESPLRVQLETTC